VGDLIVKGKGKGKGSLSNSKQKEENKKLLELYLKKKCKKN
tara:strand:- start:172 stop:294 length:123 start_codon:yes stop_codon:yes gene_type:complete